MSYTIKQYPGDGSNKNFPVTFSYISTAHVEVRVNSVLMTNGVDYTWDGPGIVKFYTAPAPGTLVDIRRETPKTERLVQFQDASILTADSLNVDSQQDFNLMQEVIDAIDNTIGLSTDGTFDAKNHRVTNLLTPVNPNDAVNKHYVDTAPASAASVAVQAALQAESLVTAAEEQVALATSKVASISPETILRTDQNLSDLSNVPTARSNLGLGTAATKDVGTGPGMVPAADANGRYGLGDNQYAWGGSWKGVDLAGGGWIGAHTTNFPLALFGNAYQNGSSMILKKNGCGMVILGALDGTFTFGSYKSGNAGEAPPGVLENNFIIPGRSFVGLSTAKMWVNFDGISAALTGATFTYSGTTITATLANHNLNPGRKITISGGTNNNTVLNGTWVVSSVLASNMFTFEINSTPAGALSTISIQPDFVRASLAVASITRPATGAFIINFGLTMQNNTYAVMGSISDAVAGYGSVGIHATNATSVPTLMTESAVQIKTNVTSAAGNSLHTSVAIFGA